MTFQNLKFPAVLFIFAFLGASCSDDTPAKDNNTVMIDSAFAAQKAMSDKFPTRSKDTLHMLALPPVFEGDLVFQNLDNPFCKHVSEVFGSKYNNVGMIFIRPRDHLYMVLSAIDSTKAVPLTEWVDHGLGQHVALLRLKNSNAILSAKKMDKMKTTMKPYRGRPYDQRLEWGDESFYASELMWKAYHNGLNIDLCTPKMLNQYNAKADPTQQAVSPDDIYHSDKLEVIYEH